MNKKDTLKEHGVVAFRKQIKEAGGLIDAQQVAELLGTTPDAVRKRDQRGGLLSVSLGEGSNYPVWQFDETGVIDDFPEVMKMLDTESPVSIFRFFLTYDENLKKNPIEALKGGDTIELEMVYLLAKQFNQQVAR